MVLFCERKKPIEQLNSGTATHQREESHTAVQYCDRYLDIVIQLQDQGTSSQTLTNLMQYPLLDPESP